ncbi:hypothetical protein [Streptomyces sp. NPDC056296]|uniref:hypothetical protein n=1 Tax=Streptomyces sp. NPDC056296 TaxID=3345775 RepID=UPI0035D91414
MLCAHLWSPEGRLSPFGPRDASDDRIGILIPFGREKQDYVGYSTSRLLAAASPEVVALVPLSASPYWRRMAGGTEAEPAPFFAEATGHVTYPYSPPDLGGDAIARWALDGLLALVRPTSDDLHTRPRPRHPSRARGEPARPPRIERDVAQSQPPDQGRTLLFPGHLEPVLLRGRPGT